MKLFYVALGGVAGALLRYTIGLISTKLFGTAFPIGTLIVNLTGCFLIGLIFGLGEQRGINPMFRLFFITGFLGALTTFSSYSLETVNNANKGALGIALANIAFNNIAGLTLTWAGMRIASIL